MPWFIVLLDLAAGVVPTLWLLLSRNQRNLRMVYRLAVYVAPAIWNVHWLLFFWMVLGLWLVWPLAVGKALWVRYGKGHVVDIDDVV